ncbi:Aspartate--tRNA(Asp/Asn) ligase [Candidatus Gugararchaeum adminiculabundum]|nr:Aspartate--tRNA(Asp/Asn) ligase [Candidatus Gugararchaeum adminiculabundum]
MMRTHYAAEVTPALDGKEVTVAGWVHETRDLGKIRFILLRDRTGKVQVIGKKGIVDDSLLALMSQVKETVLQIKGKVKASPQAPGGIELIPSSVTILNEVSGLIPFEVTEKAAEPEIDVRLDFRYVDLRRPKPAAIFKIKSEIITSFREYLVRQHGFVELTPTSIVAAATEGGSNLFPIVYFDKTAYLAQSPQLYKQLAVIGGFDRTMMTTPAFRAEKHNTTSHLNEVLQMDIEMGFADHHDVMKILGDVAIHVLSQVKKNCKPELETLGVDLHVPDKVPMHTYSSLVDLLNKNGVKFEWGDDFSRETEGEIHKLLKETLYFIHEWPTAIRAFYSMPKEGNEKICNAFDLMYNGTEISSGAQRIHKPDLLIKAIQDRGMDPANFEFYINAFRTGAPPHAGWSVGLERIAMKACGIQNIRECALFPRDRTRVTP